MTTLSNSLVLSTNPPLQLFSGSHGSASSTNLAFNSSHLRKLHISTSRRPLTVQASYSDGERSSSANAFVGGFVLGGLVVGALGCVFAPQISKALAVADSKDLMKRLPKFIYDEEKALEKTRKVLTEKIAQLNAAIDDVSGKMLKVCDKFYRAAFEEFPTL
ncbi:Inhibitory regulator IRA1 [Gossypium arboreum]|uniref:Inhibitory regulator IRA1 n=1 Tax=Gossypium arboreum TaxID=29729 RepID=A0A0B0MNZ7_GOSAR|nr:Inhibitory regulator IRA1 [Gossypium arboreum]